MSKQCKKQSTAVNHMTIRNNQETGKSTRKIDFFGQAKALILLL